MNATKSAKAAGYSEKTGYSIGHKLLKHPKIKAEIEAILDSYHEQQRRSFIVLSDAAIMALEDVMNNGRGMSKVNAANSILDRGGHKPLDRVQSDVNANVKNEMSLVDARAELFEKLNRNFPIEEGKAGEDNDVEPRSSANPSD